MSIKTDIQDGISVGSRGRISAGGAADPQDSQSLVHRPAPTNAEAFTHEVDQRQEEARRATRSPPQNLTPTKQGSSQALLRLQTSSPPEGYLLFHKRTLFSRKKALKGLDLSGCRVGAYLKSHKHFTEQKSFPQPAALISPVFESQALPGVSSSHL